MPERDIVLLYAPHYVAPAARAGLTYRAMPPLSHLALAGPLREAGYQVRILDAKWDFDWREQGDEIWHILIETKDGQKIRLFEGGAALAVGDAVVVNQPREEYQRIYERFAKLVTGRRSDVDIRPLRLVADAMMIGRRETTDPFAW